MISPMRLEKLRKIMREKGFEGVLLSSPINQSYITGASFDDGYVAITDKRCVICVDFRYFEAVKASAAGIDVELAKGSTLDRALDILLSDGAKIIAIEENDLSFATFKKIAEKVGESAELKEGANAMLSRMRAVKSADELEKTAKAQEITDAAYEHILRAMTPNMTEREVALELEFFMRKSGAEAMAFDVIAVSGSASSLPHGVPRNVKLERGFLTMDFGARLDGYCSDMTRTVVIGRADAEMKKLYNTVLTAQKAALDALAAGFPCADADKVARDIINAAGYEGCFGHSLGHGVGRYIHEAPNLSPRSEAMLEIGNVVTVEPGIYLEGKYGCRIEDMVAITENRIHNFTKSKKELTELF